MKKFFVGCAAFMLVVGCFGWELPQNTHRNSVERPLRTSTTSCNNKGSEREVRESLFQAAEGGLAQAQFQVGLCFFRGSGVPKNYGMAEKWFRRAAEQGFAEAQFVLYLMYDRGWGVKANRTEADKWLNKVAGRIPGPQLYNLFKMIEECMR